MCMHVCKAIYRHVYVCASLCGQVYVHVCVMLHVHVHVHACVCIPVCRYEILPVTIPCLHQTADLLVICHIMTTQICKKV